MNRGLALDVFEIFWSVGMEVRVPETPNLQGGGKSDIDLACYDTPDQFHYLQHSLLCGNRIC